MKITRTRDSELVAKLNENVQNVHSDLYPSFFKPYNYEEIKDFFIKIIDNPEFIFLIAEDEGEPVGYAWIEIKTYPESVFKKSYQSVFLYQLSVSAEKMNKGYGTAFMNEIFTIARNHNVKRVELDYWIQNEQASSFYKKLGFEKYREFVYKEI